MPQCPGLQIDLRTLRGSGPEAMVDLLEVAVGMTGCSERGDDAAGMTGCSERGDNLFFGDQHHLGQHYNLRKSFDQSLVITDIQS